MKYHADQKQETAEIHTGELFRKPASEEVDRQTGSSSYQEAASVYGASANNGTMALPISVAPPSGKNFIPFPSSPPDMTEPSIEMWSSSVQSLLDDIPSALPHQLIVAGLIFCVSFGTWSWFGTVDEVGKAQGKLIPKGETYKIETIELGKVSQIAVKEGQEVKAGQLIVELDTELTEKEIDRLKNLLLTYKLELQQKQGLGENVEIELKSQEAIAAAQQLAHKVAISSAMEKRQTILQLLVEQQNQIKIYQERQNQLEKLSPLAEQRLGQLQSAKVAHQERLKRLEPLQKAGAISQDFIFNAQQGLRETEQQITQISMQEVTDTRQQIFQAGQALRELQGQLIEENGKLALIQREIEQLQADLIGKQAEGNSVQIKGQQSLQQLELEITQLQGKISETENLLLSEQTKLKHKYLRAPVDGVILSLNPKNRGVVVQPGETLAEIAPEGAPLVVSAVLPNQEAGFIKPGMPVQVKIDAFPYQDYGVVSGQVTTISANSEKDEQLGEIYRVQINLDKDYVNKNQQMITFKPGQTVNADILIRRRRILDVLLDPIRKMQKNGITL